MHNLQGPFVGFQFLIKNLNSEKESTFLKVSGSEFHTIGPKYLIEFWPKYIAFICGTTNSDCDRVCMLLFCKNRTDVVFDAITMSHFTYFCCSLLNVVIIRPSHDVWAIATPVLSPAQIKKKEAWAGDEKPAQRQSCMGWYRPHKIVNNSSRIHINWFKEIHFKLILTFLFMLSF